MIYVSGSECIGRCGQLPLKGSASSDLHQFVKIVVIKSLNSNCVLVLMFQCDMLFFLAILLLYNKAWEVARHGFC